MMTYGVIDLFDHGYEIVDVLGYDTQRGMALVTLASLEAFDLPHTYVTGVPMEAVGVYLVDHRDEPPC